MSKPQGIRRWHRLMGMLLVLPFLVWAVTGVIFHIKPGYGEAYARITPRFYPLREAYEIRPSPDWQSFQVMRTLLGDHLLVRTTEGERRHLSPATLAPMPEPSAADLTRLFEEAIAANPQRYGTLGPLTGTATTTSTGVKISLDWASLTMSQYGPDTRLIDTLYRMHYLQWTGQTTIDRLLPLAGLALLVLMTGSGIRLLFQGRRNRAKPGVH